MSELIQNSTKFPSMIQLITMLRQLETFQHPVKMEDSRNHIFRWAKSKYKIQLNALTADKPVKQV
jgi:hypothetical protein